jgi:hypothetical protein
MSSKLVKVVHLAAEKRQLAGRVYGESAFEKLIVPSLPLIDNQILILSFKGAELVTGSFLKATWLRLEDSEENRVRAAVAHLSDDLRTDFETFLRGSSLAALEALDWKASGIRLARVLGDLEPAALTTLQAILKRPGSTAPELHDESTKDVSATAWTNRLNELYRQGLARREKAGRAWRFFPTTEKIEHG